MDLLGLVSPSSLVAVLATAAILFFAAPMLAARIVRWRSDRLPADLSARFYEEWLAEVQSIDGRFGKLMFAISLLTMRTSALAEPIDIDRQAAIPGAAFVVVSSDVTVYSDFWSRLWAYLIDGVLWALVTLPFDGLATGAFSLDAYHRPHFTLVWNTVGTLLVYVAFVLRFGGTPGKLAMKLRIVPVDGSPLSIRHAVLRQAPNYVVGALLSVTTIVALSHTTWPAQYDALPAAQQRVLLASLVPGWFPGLLQIFSWTDVLTFFANDERRALHDYVAGTVVIVTVPQVIAQPDALPPARSTSSFQ